MAKTSTKKSKSKTSTPKRDPIAQKLRRLIQPNQQFESTRNLITEAASPSKLVALLRRVDAGELSIICQLQEEMEAKSAQFQGVCETRRNAITGLDWCIEPDQDLVTDTFANEVAEYCEQTLVGLTNFEEALTHLSSALGPNIAVLEKVWEKAELVDLGVVPYTRLRTNMRTNLGVAIVTPEVQMGIDVESMPDKFVVYHRHWNGGFPFRRTMTHASVLPFLFLNLSQKDWSAYSELFGQPLRYGTAPVGADQEVLSVLRDMLENLGSDTAAMFPSETDIKFLQSQGTGETYQRQLDYADTKLAILWLGQNLTTEISQQGSRAAAQVHNEVRGDLLKADIRAEAQCIRNQILAPMVELAFPGRMAPIPYFVRKVEANRDVEGERADIEKIKMAKELGLSVTTEWLYGALRIPKPPIELPEVWELKPAVDPFGAGEEVDADGNPIPSPLDKKSKDDKNPTDKSKDGKEGKP